MNNHTRSKASYCWDSLTHKARHWPPSPAPAPSAASGLRKRQTWQPQSWQKLHLVCLLLGVLTFGRPCTAQPAEETVGTGTLTFTGADDQSSEAPRLHTDVRIEVSGIIARVEVRQRFQNPGDRWVAGIYAFPRTAGR